MEKNFETLAYAMQTRTLKNILRDFHGIGQRVERDSCAGTATVYAAKDSRVILRAIQTSRHGLGAWIVRAEKGWIVKEESPILLPPTLPD